MESGGKKEKSKLVLDLKQILFYAAGIAFSIIIVLWLVSAVSFLTKSIDKVFIAAPRTEGFIKFDIEGFESLDLIRK